MNNSNVDIDSYVAKYMDENGCSFSEACEELQIDENDVFSRKESNGDLH